MSKSSLMVVKQTSNEKVIVKGLFGKQKKQNPFNLRQIIEIENDNNIRICAGLNRIAEHEGKKLLSPYLTYSGEAFSKLVNNNILPNIKPIELESEDHVFKEALVTDNLILLGGPVANKIGGQYTGYTYKMLGNGSVIPIFDTCNLRWGYYCGDLYGGYGYFDGEYLNAKRCEGNLIVERPLYAIKDNNKGLIRFQVNHDNFLLEEVLLITKIIQKSSSSIFVIGGMHGYSIQEFSREIQQNIERIDKKVGKSESYQIFLPVTLIHDLGKINITMADLRWDDALLEKY